MVFPKHEGNGYGQMLVAEAISFARENNWKIYPHCSFSRSVLVNMKDVSDVYPRKTKEPEKSGSFSYINHFLALK